MTQNHNLKALERMSDALQSLQNEIEHFGAGERFWRSGERSREFVAAASRVQSQLEIAQKILCKPGGSDRKDRKRAGWLSRTARGLLQYLSTGGDEKSDDLRGGVGVPTKEVLGDSFDGGVLQGHGAVMEFSDLLVKVRGQSMTGVLTLSMPDEVANLHFEAGQLVHAYSENAPSELRLGDVLVGQGVMSPEYMESLLSIHWNSPLMLGETLLNDKHISIEQLRDALSYQVQSLFDRIFEYSKQASFCFVPGLPNTNAQRAQVNLMQLLIDSEGGRNSKAAVSRDGQDDQRTKWRA
ncbi:MAG: DUF4388 domain-containing protein [bacterium]|nr:DUF4388 domain-containing protein [bacterium]